MRISRSAAVRKCLLAGLSLLVGLSVPTKPAHGSDVQTAERLFRASKWAQARETYLELLPELQGNERARALRQIGWTLQIQHHHQDALPYFERVLEMKDIDTEHVSGALLRLGYSLRMLKRGEEGIRMLDQAAETVGAPSSHVAEARLYAAWEHNTRGEIEAALDKFRRIESIPDVHANYVATALLSTGRILQGQGKYREAIAAYERLDGLNPVAAVNRARARVYRLECQALLAGDTPFHIRPFATSVTGGTARVHWVSQGEIPPGRVVVTSPATGRASPVETAPLKDTICHLHVATLSGLTPGSVVEYQVECGGETVASVFRTAPDPGTPFSFSLIGDTQSYHEGLQPLLDRMAATPSDFVLHVGDITDRGRLWGEWKASFFDPGQGYLKDRTFWPVYGNHDGGPYFPALFGRQQQYWYSFDWGDAHFIVLDSYGAGSGGKGREAQLEWLKQDLAASDRLWTFVALHVPMVATRPSLKWFGEDDFLPLLEQHEVDAVFSGHHPHYRRYTPIGTPGKRPILHITSGGGGGPVGGYVPSPLLARGIDLNHFCHVQIDGPRLLLEAHAINGAVIDRLELRKDAGSPVRKNAVATAEAKSLIALYQDLLTDRSFELWLQAEAPVSDDGTVPVSLNLEKLPRGPLEPGQFAADTRLVLETTAESAWHMERQQFALQEGSIRFHLKARPANSSADVSRSPARVRLTLVKDGRTFEPVDVTARILMPTGGPAD